MHQENRFLAGSSLSKKRIPVPSHKKEVSHVIRPGKMMSILAPSVQPE
jgi:hypothetical protein